MAVSPEWFTRVAKRLSVLVCAWALVGCSSFGPALPELSVSPAPGSVAVDPRAPVTVEVHGVGARLTAVKIQDQAGKTVLGTLSEQSFTVNSPLAFGTQYRLRAQVSDMLGNHRVTQEMHFSTVALPKLEGSGAPALAADGSVTLRFDRPVGTIRPAGDSGVDIQPDPSRRSVRLTFPHRPEGKTLAVKLNWETPNGVPLPPLEVNVIAAPPLSATLDLEGQSEVGIALPLSLSFSEPLTDRGNAAQHLTVATGQGGAIAGRWHWVGDRRLRFTPQPHWPPNSKVVVSAKPGSLTGAKGGIVAESTLGSFNTGPDRRIAVYLDKQRVVALEDGEVVRTFRASTGKAATPTVTGDYYIYARFPLKTMRSDAKPGEPGYYVVENVPYAQYFHRDYALHGAWWHNGFGRPASHGCINLATQSHNRRWPSAPEDAGWLYEWASLGVPVHVYAKAPAH